MRARGIVSIGAAAGLALMACEGRQPCSCNTEITPERITCIGGTESIVQIDNEARIYCENARGEQITFYAPGDICEKNKVSHLRIMPDKSMEADPKNVPPEYHLRLWGLPANEGISKHAQEQWDSILKKSRYVEKYCE